MKLIAEGQTLNQAALKTGMDEKTARRYRRAKSLPSTMKTPHTWRTRSDPFEEVWPELQELLQANPGLQAVTLLAHLQRRYPGRFADGQLRTLQRRLKVWRAQEGPPKEVFFPQEHFPGELDASDFCHMSGLGITIQGRPFNHLLYHFVLTYSNWETGCICFSESFESLSAGLQDALWELGGVPQRHRTDSLSAAVHNLAVQLPQLSGQPSDQPREEFRRRYAALLNHYGLRGEHIQAGQAHENGDVEQRSCPKGTRRFKTALDQSLMLRSSRDFNSRQEYAHYLHQLFAQLNAGRRQRFEEECRALRTLPARRLDTRRQLPGFLGVGGGFLLVPALRRFANQTMKLATGTSLGIIALNAAAGFAAHLNEVRDLWPLALALTAAALVGLAAGLKLAGRVPARGLEKTFAGVAMSVAVYLAYMNVPQAGRLLMDYF